jgi:hypothetical protein
LTNSFSFEVVSGSFHIAAGPSTVKARRSSGVSSTVVVADAAEQWDESDNRWDAGAGDFGGISDNGLGSIVAGDDSREKGNYLSRSSVFT